MEPRNEREGKLLAAVEQRPAGWYAGRGGRHRLVALMTGLVGLLWVNAGVSWALAPSDTAMYTCFAILGIVLLACVPLWSALLVRSRGAVGLPEHLLDERQRAERLRAHAISHRLTLLLLFVTYFVVMLALPDEGAVVTGLPSAAVILLFLALLATIAALPPLVVAWRLTDPPDDDEDEDPDEAV